MIVHDLERGLEYIYEKDDSRSYIVNLHMSYICELMLLRDMDYNKTVDDLLTLSHSLIHASSGRAGVLAFADKLRNTASDLEVAVKRSRFHSVAGPQFPCNRNQPADQAE